MLQIFVRPPKLGLEPTIQHEPIPAAVIGEWRHLFGPEEGEAPLSVRNEVDLYDAQLEAGAELALPARPGRHTYLYVFEGAVELAGTSLAATESALVADEGTETIRAQEPTALVAFSIDPDAPVTRRGTIGR